MASIMPKFLISQSQLDQFKAQSFFVSYSLTLMTGVLYKGVKFHDIYSSCFGYGSFEELELSAQKFNAPNEDLLRIVTAENIPVISKILAEKINHITEEDAAIALSQLIEAVERTSIVRERKAKQPQRKLVVPASPVTDYAKVVLTDGLTILQFTDLGQQIFDDASSILPKKGKPFDVEKVAARFDEIIAEHPNNPWPLAMKVCCLFKPYYQGSWIEDLPYDDKKGFAFDHPNQLDFKAHCEENAVSLFETARESISLFSSLFLNFANSDEKNVLLSIPMAGEDVIKKGCETYYWPAILYFGGCIAQNCGRNAYAKKSFIQLQKITNSIEFDVNYKLATIALIDKNGLVKRILKDSKVDLWGHLLLAAQSFEKGEKIMAFDHFSEAMIASWGAIEAFGARLEGARSLRVEDARKAPALVHEFMFATRAYWESNTKAFTFFKNIASNKELRQVLLDYHKADVALFVDNTLSPAVKAKRENNALVCREAYDDLIIKILSSSKIF